MIITAINAKGGVGKTTLAVNLAVALALAGRDLLLVDGDEQGTALTFTQLRAERLGQAGYTAVALTGAALRSQVRQLATKYDDIIIDVGGRDTGSLRAALTVADTLLVPVQPRSFDVWALDQVSALVAEAREINEGLRAVAVLNGADAQGADNEAALDMIGDIDGIEAKKPTASSTSICSTSPMLLPRQVTASVSGLKRWPPQVSQGTFTSGRKDISMVRMPWPSQAGQRPSPVLKLKRPGP